MMAVKEKTTMLYCPKCRRAYENGTRRFCDSDGGRLLPAPTAEDNASPAGGVFSNLLSKTLGARDTENKSKSSPLFVPFNKTEETDVKLTSFPSAGRIFQSEQFLKPKKERAAETEDSILELEPTPAPPQEDSILEFEPLTEIAFEPPTFENVLNEPPKPAPRLIRPNEIASGTATVGDRRTNPLGRQAFRRENTAALVGQTVKGRYLITEQLAEDDEESVIFLAEDQIFENRKTVVRVFLDDYSATGETEDKIFAEERVSLSHLNHPNIAGVFDSGELPEGNEFIVSEFIEGKTLASVLKESGQFNSLRTARIVRQVSYALSEAHQNGILHRNLKPENIVLTVSEAGIEQVKLMNFGVSRGEINESNFAYKAPEEIERGISTYASDIYSLAVIAFEMLTGRFPFDFETDGELFKAQKRGLLLKATELRAEIQPSTDKVLEKALAFNPAERYPKARDFGDAFFNALTTVAKRSTVEEETNKLDKRREFFVVPAINEPVEQVEESPITADIHITPSRRPEELIETDMTGETTWEKRSQEPPKNDASWRGWAAIAGVVALLLVFWGVSRLYFNSVNQTDVPAPVVATETPLVPVINALPAVEGDMPPQPRIQQTPEGFVRFQNSRESLKGDLAKNFLGFEIFYPQGWTKTDTPKNFFDVAKKADYGYPFEQMIVTYYESRGTVTLDRANFPKLVEKSNQALKGYFGDTYKIINEGETTIQNGRWKAYEVKFQGVHELNKGEKVTFWGRRLWIPVQTPGQQSGFVLTLLATSLSDQVKSVEDVGTKGELAGVFETFEPEQVVNR